MNNMTKGIIALIVMVTLMIGVGSVPYGNTEEGVHIVKDEECGCNLFGWEEENQTDEGEQVMDVHDSTKETIGIQVSE